MEEEFGRRLQRVAVRRVCQPQSGLRVFRFQWPQCGRRVPNLILQEIHMNKLFAAIIAAAFAAVSFGAIAAKHEEGMKKDAPKAEKKAEAKKAAPKKEEKKADKK
jgi:hypothetical protein